MAQETDEQVMIAAETIKRLLHLVDPDKRLQVLERTMAREQAARHERDSDGGAPPDCFAEGAHQAAAPYRQWLNLLRFKSAVIQVFTRDIRNSNSEQDAARILFERHSNGTGTGWLPDYLYALPGVTVDRKKAAAIAGVK